MILNVFKKYIGIGLVGITVTDRYGGVCPIRGSSMSPTFNPSLGSFTGMFQLHKTYSTCVKLHYYFWLQMIMFSWRNFALTNTDSHMAMW